MCPFINGSITNSSKADLMILQLGFKRERKFVHRHQRASLIIQIMSVLQGVSSFNDFVRQCTDGT